MDTFLVIGQPKKYIVRPNNVKIIEILVMKSSEPRFPAMNRTIANERRSSPRLSGEINSLDKLVLLCHIINTDIIGTRKPWEKLGLVAQSRTSFTKVRWKRKINAMERKNIWM